MSIGIFGWNLVIQLTLLAGVGLLTLASSTHNEKYVGAAYFKKHSRLIDSDFKDYISKEVLPLDTTRLSAVLKRDLIGEGSHRHLCSYIQVQLDDDIQITKQILQQQQQFWEWEIIVLERLPSGVFADPFELQHLLSRGEFRDVAVFGDTNLELPSVASNRSLVELHMEIEHNVSSSKLEVSIKLPLHARYAPLIEEEEKEEEEKRGLSRRIEFNTPDVLIRRIGNKVKGVELDDERWWLFSLSESESESNNSNGEEVVTVTVVVGWEVPRGMKSHTLLVSVITFIAAAVSAFIIVLTSIRY